MCGISGIINFNDRIVKENDIQNMMHIMKHRGPDDDGVFIDQSVGLGFVRLSILDLSSAGHQPMLSHDKRYVIVFNGEVYNYLEIREELEHKYSFRSGTDTEVILAAYEEWGEDCLNKFNGMFAIAIFDRETRELFVARDRFGIKPFYYYVDSERFIFASEIKSLLPLIENIQANDEIIYDYLLFNRTDHSQATFFKGIRKLQHGSWLKLRDKNFTQKRWYNLYDKLKYGQELTPDQYRKLFQDSLRLRLRADVPIGVSLSGGLDSSSIVAALIEDFKLDGLNTFSAVFGMNETSDESEYIDEFRPIVKNMFFTSPDSTSFFKDFKIFIDAHNEPVPDTGPYVQYKVMELASNNVTVTLDGQGADEQLAGYHYFYGSYYIELVKQFKLGIFFRENFQYLESINL